MKTIILAEDGKYRWVYEYPMDKNLDILYQVWRILIFSGIICIFFVSIINLTTGNGLASVLFTVEIFLIICGILIILSVPAYMIVARVNGNVYTVMYEMDDNGIEHIQLMTDKAKALEYLTVLSGLKGRNLTLTATGINRITRNSLYSDFSKVRRIITVPEKNLIRVNGLFTRNQIYVEEDDYQFVADYIQSHCPKAN